MALPIDPTIPPMEARPVAELPSGAQWRFEPKWDGFRCLAFRDGDHIELRSKSGQMLGRYFPDVVAALAALPSRRFSIDGEIVIPVERRLSFEALQLRLHPAESRVRKLVAEHPACSSFSICSPPPTGPCSWNIRLPSGGVRWKTLSRHRGTAPASVCRRVPRIATRLSAGSAALGPTSTGSSPNAPTCLTGAERGTACRNTSQRTADCVVGGFRYGRDTRLVGSLLLGLYDEDGLLHHVGFTATFPARDKPALTAPVEQLIEPPGFTGRAPGGPSRWSTERTGDWHPLRPELVVEVRYDHVTDNRFRHGTTLLRWRPDKAPRQCTFDQLTQTGDSALALLSP